MEMMVVMAITAILLSLAVPSFRNFLADSEVASNVNEFVGAFALARSEAVMRAKLVTICRSGNAESGEMARCNSAAMGDMSSADWAPGWIVYVENSSSTKVGSREPGELILLRKGTMRDRMHLIQTAASKARNITFNGSGEPTGSMTGQGFNFNNDGEFLRQICIARTGRLRLIKGATSCA